MTRAKREAEFERLAIAYAMVARAQVSAYQSDDYCAISSMELRFQETYAALKAFALREPEGEVVVVEDLHDRLNCTYRVALLPSTKYHPGQRVRVSRMEEE